MADPTNPEETDLDRVGRLIAELDGEEFLLTGLDPAPASPEIEMALIALREQRARLEEELAEVWAKTCGKC
ncbi:MAG TPA: hypothetical protein VGN01_08890 [Acidobacteriaceae bacterium]|jgi:hypothetical protein